jgi:16S rRNA (cytosine967-C5)-methyltransferase
LSRYHAYLRNAVSLIKDYGGELPLAIYLKQFFAANKKFGSSDRRMVGGLTHQYYRAGHLTDNMDLEEGVMLAELLCNNIPSSFLQALRPQWESKSALSLSGKLESCGYQWKAASHTPWLNLLQKEMDAGHYVLSQFVQPDLFLRVRPGKSIAVKNKLNNEGLSFIEEGESCLRLPNGSRLDNILSINAEVVVQDKSSQQCGAIIKRIIPEFSGQLWDVCAASGGKSIMLYDIYKGKPKLVVSDIRESILHNLRERFRAAGVNHYHSFTTDLTQPLADSLHSFQFDMLLVDAPCTGSGTWARTPEQHYFFKPEKAAAFAETQFAICTHALPHLKSGGVYIYITCSVFEIENQAICTRLQAAHNLQLLHQEIIDGTLLKADSMFIAIFRKP